MSMRKSAYWSENWLKRANNYLGLSRLMLNPDWIDKQIGKGRLASGYKEAIERLVPVLQSVYPDRWDIQFNVEINYKQITNLYKPLLFNEWMYNDYIEHYGEGEILEEHLIPGSQRAWSMYSNEVYENFTDYTLVVPSYLHISHVFIVIHFPEVTITNSDGESLILKNLFTRTILRSDGTIGTSLEGARSTFTIPEMCTGYVHSHLHSINWSRLVDSATSNIGYTMFCLGESDIITFAQLYNADRDLGNFESYLHMLNSVVSWESLEGGPFIKMNTTVQKTTGIVNVSRQECIMVLDRLINKKLYYGEYPDELYVDWVFRDGKYLIVDNEKFEDFLRSAYTSSKPAFPIVIYKDEKGEYFTPTNISENYIKGRYVDFIPFRGQKFQLKVEGEIKLVNNHKWYINPKIKSYVKSRLESIFNKIKTKKHCIEWLNQVSNNRGVHQ